MKAAEAFYAKGIRFECQGSGKCCMSRGTHGYVYLTLADRKRFAGHLGIDVRTFDRRYCERTDGHIHLKNPAADCQFLDGKRCSVYEGRPSQCRTWPFWPENMNAKSWNREIKTFCPGVGKGRVYTQEEINGLLAEDPISPRIPG